MPHRRIEQVCRCAIRNVGGQYLRREFAVLLDTHEVVLAEGAAAETFHISSGNHENFSNFAEYERLYAAEGRTAMTSYAPVAGEEGGWKHLKSLLLLGASRLIPMRDRYEEACEKINARARELSSCYVDRPTRKR